MKQEDYVVAVVSSPWVAEIECDNNNNRPDDMKRMAFMTATQHYWQLDWQPFLDEAGLPRLKVERLRRKQRIILEDGDEVPEGMEVDDEGIGTLDEDFEDPQASTVTGAEEVSGSPDDGEDADEMGERLAEAVTALQGLVEVVRAYRAGNPPPTDEVDGALEQAKAFLDGALSPDDVDENGKPEVEG